MAVAGPLTETQRAIVAAAASGDNELVAAVPGFRIHVLGYVLITTAMVTVRFESGAGGTALSGQMELDSRVPLVVPYNPEGWFTTLAGESLNLELSGAVSVAGHLGYVLVSGV